MATLFSVSHGSITSCVRLSRSPLLFVYVPHTFGLVAFPTDNHSDLSHNAFRRLPTYASSKMHSHPTLRPDLHRPFLRSPRFLLLPFFHLRICADSSLSHIPRAMRTPSSLDFPRHPPLDNFLPLCRHTLIAVPFFLCHSIFRLLVPTHHSQFLSRPRTPSFVMFVTSLSSLALLHVAH